MAIPEINAMNEEHEQDNPNLVKPEDLPPGVQLRPHVYDGIQEYDQRLPNWWLWSFYICIIAYGVYWLLYYQVGLFRSDEERLAEKMRIVAEKAAGQTEALLSDLNHNALWQLSRDEEFVASGKTIYGQMCSACHGADLSGMIGEVRLPGTPLNSGNWIHASLEGTSEEDEVTTDAMTVFNIIHDGSPNPAAGMQAWGPVLGPNGTAEVTAYVLSFHQAPAEANVAGPPSATATP